MDEKNIIFGTGKDPDTHMVRKTNAIYDITSSYQIDQSDWPAQAPKDKWSLSMLKILDAYLARINPNEPQKRTVVFSKGEIERYLGVDRIKANDLNARIDRLGKPLMSIQGKTTNKIWLFEKASFSLDSNGRWTVALRCSEAAMNLIFNNPNFKYFVYALRTIIPLKKQYSYNMVMYLARKRAELGGFYSSEPIVWEEKVEDLKSFILRDEDAVSYTEYSRFNTMVLKGVKEEIDSQTEIRFSYEPCAFNNRKTVALKFTLSKYDCLSYNKTIAAAATEETEDEDNDRIRKAATDLSALASNNEPDELVTIEMTQRLSHICTIPGETRPFFDTDEIKQIVASIAELPEGFLPRPTENISTRREALFKNSFDVLLKTASMRKIDNPVGYMKQIIKNASKNIERQQSLENLKRAGTPLKTPNGNMDVSFGNDEEERAEIQRLLARNKKS